MTIGSAPELAIFGAEDEADIVGKFAERGAIDGSQRTFLKNDGGAREVRKGAILTFGDGGALRSKTVGEQVGFKPILFDGGFFLAGPGKILAQFIQFVGKFSQSVKKLAVVLRQAEFVEAFAKRGNHGRRGTLRVDDGKREASGGLLRELGKISGSRDGVQIVVDTASGVFCNVIWLRP